MKAYALRQRRKTTVRMFWRLAFRVCRTTHPFAERTELNQRLWALRVRRNGDGQAEVKRCPWSGVGGGPEAAAMRFDDRSTDRQPHPGAMRLGREECVEDLIRVLSRQPGAG